MWDDDIPPQSHDDDTDGNRDAFVRFSVIFGFSVMIAMLAPSQLFAMLLYKTLFFGAVAMISVALARQEPILGRSFTCWDVGVALLSMSLLSGMFVDHDLVKQELLMAGIENPAFAMAFPGMSTGQ